MYTFPAYVALFKQQPEQLFHTRTIFKKLNKPSFFSVPDFVFAVAVSSVLLKTVQFYEARFFCAFIVWTLGVILCLLRRRKTKRKMKAD